MILRTPNSKSLTIPSTASIVKCKICDELIFFRHLTRQSFDADERPIIKSWHCCFDADNPKHAHTHEHVNKDKKEVVA
jgi:hypothetical protein